MKKPVMAAISASTLILLLIVLALVRPEGDVIVATDDRVEIPIVRQDANTHPSRPPAASDRRRPLGMPPIPVQSPGDGIIEPEAQAYDLGNPQDRERFKATLRTAGTTEDEITRILKEPPQEEATHSFENIEARSFDLTRPSDQQAFRESLEGAGMPEEEIQRVLRRPQDDSQASDSTLPSTEAQVYDLGNFSDREKLSASLRIQGIADEDIPKIMRPPPDSVP